MASDLCVICRTRPADITYAVDPDPQKEKRICSECYRQYDSPRRLDRVLGVEQLDYGIEKEIDGAQEKVESR